MSDRPLQIDPDVLRQSRALPDDPIAQRIVLWRTFRSLEAALEYSRHILLGHGQHVVGGATYDDLGVLYWLGVQVDDLSKWGNTKAIQLTDHFDGANPDVQGRPFESK